MSENLFPPVTSVESLDDLLSKPTKAAIDAMKRIEGDILFLGVAGKMGPTMARMAVRASEAAGVTRKVIGVSRFSDTESEAKLKQWGIETIKGDLLNPDFMSSLPQIPNVVYMAGLKFGSTGLEPLTWAMNAYLPALVCEHFQKSRIAAFSTGCVYGFVPVSSKGSVESDELNPVGEYAMSCLGRERMFQYFCDKNQTRLSIIRLNYATELRYGVLVDMATQVRDRKPIELGMGYVNVIWQGDANAMSLCTLADASYPYRVMNVAGPEKLRVRDVCHRFAELMGTEVTFTGEESSTAALNDGLSTIKQYGKPRIDIEQLLHWTAAWVLEDRESLGKPTHFEALDGKY